MRQFRTVLLVTFICLVLCSVCCPVSSLADSLDNWTWRYPLPTGNPLTGTTYGNGGYVTVGSAGTIMTSPDAATWNVRPSGTHESLQSVTFGMGTFVAVGDSGTVLTSSDGISWTSRASGTLAKLNRITFGNGMFVAVGDSGTILVSSDALTWTSRISGTGANLISIAYGEGVFVAVGYSGTIVTSYDTLTWTPRPSGATAHLNDVTYGNGMFVAVGYQTAVVTSHDGVTWSAQQELRVGGPFGGDRLSGIAFGNGYFVIVGDSNPPWGLFSYVPFVRTSSDGVTWIRSDSPGLREISYLNGIFVGFGGNVGSYTSTDGINWSSTAPKGFTVKNVTYGKGVLVAVDQRAILTSSNNGVTWTESFRSSDINAGLHQVAFGNGTFVAAGGTIVTSPDGVTWIEQKKTVSPQDMVFGNGIFVIVGTSSDGKGMILSSPDGINWTSRDAGNSISLASVAFGNGVFVVVGRSGAILTSPDGVTWTPRVSGTTLSLYKVTYVNGAFMAFAYDLRSQGFTDVLTSADGITWKVSARGLPGLLQNVAYGNGTYVAPSNYASSAYPSTIYTSADGETWNAIKREKAGGLGRVAFARGTFVIVGENGTVLTSSDGATWASRFSGTYNWLSFAIFFDNTFIVFGHDAILQSAPLPPYVPRITANGLAGPVTLKSSDTLSLQISLGADEGLGPDADWWVAANTPMGWFYYVHPGQWYYAPLFPLLADLRPAYQGPLFNLPVLEVLNISGLPAGSYIFYFGVDAAVNGVIDYDRLLVEYVDVTIQ